MKCSKCGHRFGKKPKIPTLAQVNGYIKEKSLGVNGWDFFEYFNAGDWYDSEGKPVLNWKQKLITWNKNSNGKRIVNPAPSFNNSDGFYKSAPEPVHTEESVRIRKEAFNEMKLIMNPYLKHIVKK